MRRALVSALEPSHDLTRPRALARVAETSSIGHTCISHP